MKKAAKRTAATVSRSVARRLEAQQRAAEHAAETIPDKMLATANLAAAAPAFFAVAFRLVAGKVYMDAHAHRWPMSDYDVAARLFSADVAKRKGQR